MQRATTAGRETLAIEGYVSKVGRLIHERGLLAVVAGALRRLGHSVVETGSLTIFARELGAEARPEAAPGFTLRQLHVADKEALLHGTQAEWPTCLSRFEAGDLCFAALDPAGRAVHTRWLTVSSARIPELEMDFVAAGDEAYFYDGYTRPDARRRGVDAAVRGLIFETLRRLGRRRVYSYVRDDNPDGSRAAGRLQRVVARVRYLRLFGSRPLVFGSDQASVATLLRKPMAGRRSESANRAADWHHWFEGFLQKPLAERSIGFHELPEAAFEAMADHISATLSLDPARDLVLDVGCDSAMVSRHVGARCASLVGVDFIPGMLLDAQRRRDPAAPLPTSLRFAAGDGRRLPFAAATFPKAYCTGVVHTLPSHQDGVAMILELVRVSKPGGRVLVAAIPDVRKRWRARREAWKLGGLRERAELVAAITLPRALRRLVRRALPGVPREPLRYLEYDLEEVKALLESRGARCTVLNYPHDFWSRDFRDTRSNLLIAIPS